MHRDIDDRLLERYCAGDCTPSEKAEVERWLAADPLRAAYVELLKTAWRETAGVDHPPERPDVQAAWRAVDERTRATEPVQPSRPPMVVSLPTPARRSRLIAALRAAAVIAAVSAGALWYATHSSPGTQQLTSGPSVAREVLTRRGQRAALDLPDGSRVVVAAESRLWIPTAYKTATGVRDVYLEGEAYFDVTHDSTRPFRVHAANGIAEDLGTEFVVTAYPETQGMQVVVASGAVALRAGAGGRTEPRPLLRLTRGDLGRLDAAGTATLTRGVAVLPYVSWASGSVVFDGARLRDAVPRLARWYDLDIRLADSALADRRLTATFRDESVAQVLELLALSLDVRVERNGSLVVLSTR